MEIVVAKSGGFCRGVKKAVDTALSVEPIAAVAAFFSRRASIFSVNPPRTAFIACEMHTENPYAFEFPCALMTGFVSPKNTAPPIVS